MSSLICPRFFMLVSLCPAEFPADNPADIPADNPPESPRTFRGKTCATPQNAPPKMSQKCGFCLPSAPLNVIVYLVQKILKNKRECLFLGKFEPCPADIPQDIPADIPADCPAENLRKFQPYTVTVTYIVNIEDKYNKKEI